MLRQRSSPPVCHMSHVLCHMSREFFFFFLSVGATWGRVCYHRGLPRLVWSHGNFPDPALVTPGS